MKYYLQAAMFLFLSTGIACTQDDSLNVQIPKSKSTNILALNKAKGKDVSMEDLSQISTNFWAQQNEVGLQGGGVLLLGAGGRQIVGHHGRPADAHQSAAHAADGSRGKPGPQVCPDGEPAAEKGHMKAQYNMGIMCAGGRGMPKDDEAAVEWYRKAAMQGYTIAMYNLGFMYQSGRGVERDYKEAVKWFKKSGE